MADSSDPSVLVAHAGPTKVAKVPANLFDKHASDRASLTRAEVFDWFRAAKSLVRECMPDLIVRALETEITYYDPRKPFADSLAAQIVRKCVADKKSISLFVYKLARCTELGRVPPAARNAMEGQGGAFFDDSVISFMKHLEAIRPPTGDSHAELLLPKLDHELRILKHMEGFVPDVEQMEDA